MIAFVYDIYFGCVLLPQTVCLPTEALLIVIALLPVSKSYMSAMWISIQKEL